MTKRSHRRQFLTAIGVGSLGLAGCTDLLGDSNGGNAGNGGNGGNGSGNGGTNGGQTQVPPPAIADGELIDGFDQVEGWTPMEGDAVGDTEMALTGEQALRIENQGTTAGVFKAFPEGLDASGSNLSMAVRVDSPRPTRVRLEIDAPARADQLWTSRTILGPHSGWLRMDAGWTGTRGEPNLGNIQEMRIYI
ncbi:MAG: polysaccharide deacetylase, partial [Halalkalicoccus sp.]|nr:polysaccharide deacetylase [Halalkalicoccus sp.]